MISFVIPSFNSVTWLPHAVQSCLEQTVKDMEIIIVDDGSTDLTAQYTNWATAHDPRIKVLRFDKNRGRSVARNEGNKLAQGDYILVLDADDIASPNRSELTLQKLKSVDFVYGSATIIDCVGKKVGEHRADVFNKETALRTKMNKIMHSTVGYTKDFAMRFPYEGGDISRLGIDDWAQQIKAALAGVRMDFVPQTICAYRVLNSAISNNRDEKAVLEAKDRFLAGLRELVSG